MSTKTDLTAEKLLAKLQSKYGEDSVMKASDIPAYDTFSTGSLSMDYAIGIGGFPTNRVVEIAGMPGTGKALALDTPIATPSGWTTMGEIEVGDEVFDEKGQPTVVTGVFEVPEPEDVFDVVFDDGTTIRACGDHLWTVWTERERRSWLSRKISQRYPDDWATWESIHPQNGNLYDIGAKTLPTRELIDSLRYDNRDGSMTRNFSIPNTKPLLYSEKELPIHPWVLGYWLGNGSKAGGEVTCGIKDFDEIASLIEEFGYESSPNVFGVEDNAPTFTIFGLRVALRELGVLGERRIPEVYLRGSVEQRKLLLAGLLDSDGYLDKAGHVEFGSMTGVLADGVEELALSLGQKTYRKTTEATLKGRSYGDFHVVTWRPTFNPHLLSRKGRRFRDEGTTQFSKSLTRFIDSVEKVDNSEPMRCIQVSSASRLYLAGRSLVPTHNTTIVLHAVNEALKKFPDKFCLYIDAEHRLTPDWVKNFVEDDDRMIVVKPDHVEQATDMYVEATTTGKCAVAVFDSIGGTPSQRVTGKSAESGNIGGNALAVTRFAQFSQINSGKYDVCTIGINQVREDMDGYNRLMTPGGRAWQHAASLRIELRRGQGRVYERVDGEETIVGYSVVVKIHKNSLAAPGKQTSYWFYPIENKNGFGIDRVDEIARLGILAGVIENPASGTFVHRSFPGNNRIRGRANVLELVQENPEVQKAVVSDVLARLSQGGVEGITRSFDVDNATSPDFDVSTSEDLTKN